MSIRIAEFFAGLEGKIRPLVSQNPVILSQAAAAASEFGAAYRFDFDRASFRFGGRFFVPITFFRAGEQVHDARAMVCLVISPSFDTAVAAHFQTFRDRKFIAFFDEFFGPEKFGSGEGFLAAVA